MSLITALIAAILLIGLAVGLQLKNRAWRRQRLKGLELRPNCLLTRYPIAFLSGRRSLFRLFSHWNDIPTYLREHGYEVLVIEPIGSRDPHAAFLAALDTLPHKCHIIGDSSVENELREIARSKHSKIATITVVKNSARDRKIVSQGHRSRKAGSLSVADLRPFDSAIEVFNVECPGEPLRYGHFLNVFALALLWLHNAVGLSRESSVDPIETGDLISLDGWALEGRFLDLAISLAERDTQWSD